MADKRRANCGQVRFRGEGVKPEQVREIRRLIRQQRGSTRQSIIKSLCRQWDWRLASGSLNIRSCRDLLCRLEERGLIKLPARRSVPGPRKRATLEATAESFLESASVLGKDDVDLRAVVVRPVLRSEVTRFREQIARFHYLGDGVLVGESLRYVAESERGWLALLSWSVAAWKSRHREQFVGWDERTKQQRLRFVVNNSRFLILPWVKVPQLASYVLAANLRRVSSDWVERYGHPVLLAETFVDLERFEGTCYRASNWIYLGQTRGMGRQGLGYKSHGKPKGLFVYPLHRRAREILAAPYPSPEILERRNMATQSIRIDVNSLPLLGEGSLIERLETLMDPRNKRGIRHPLQSVLALAVMATLSGMRSYEAIAEWAADVPKETLKALRCWCHQAPSEPTFRRVLQSIDADEVDRTVSKWLCEQKGIGGQGVALDGKCLRGSRDGEKPPFHLLSAVTHESGLVVAQQSVSEKTNEITRSASTLEDLDLKGAVVTADAMHTQKKFAKFLVDEKEADFILMAKANQPTLLEDLETQHEGDFFPQAQTIDKGHGRIEVRKIYVSDELGGYLDFPHVATTFRIDRLVTKLDGTEPREERAYGITSLAGTTKQAATKLLALVRGHWRIENSLHWVRDVTFDEDRSQIRKGNGPRVMATLRNLAISVLRLAGASSIAKALRWCGRHFDACQRLIGLST